MQNKFTESEELKEIFNDIEFDNYYCLKDYDNIH